MKKLIISNTRCDGEYASNCNFTLALLDEGSAKDLLVLIERLEALASLKSPKVYVHGLRIAGFLAVQVAAKTEDIVGLTDEEISTLEGDDELVVIDGARAGKIFDEVRVNADLYSTGIDLEVKSDSIIIEARPKHHPFSSFSREIGIDLIKEIAGGAASAKTVLLPVV